MAINSWKWFLWIFPSVLMFQQNQYNLSFERLEVVGFNTDYFGWVNTHNFKHNRTYTATILKGYLKVALGNELKIEVQAYKKASNEYREFPLRFMFDFCQYATRNEFGAGEIFACGNSTGCPFKKGVYTSCVWAPNATKFPPNVPGGSYMLDLKFFFHSVQCFYLQLYVTIKYPECKTCFF